ncbi:MAG: hypothetical protein WD355_00255 [Balneolaceae bacterium]
MDSTFIKAFREVVREEMMKKNVVDIERIGRFEVIHEKQHEERRDDGNVLMIPPVDRVHFTAETDGEA